MALHARDVTAVCANLENGNFIKKILADCYQHIFIPELSSVFGLASMHICPAYSLKFQNHVFIFDFIFIFEVIFVFEVVFTFEVVFIFKVVFMF